MIGYIDLCKLPEEVNDERDGLCGKAGIASGQITVKLICDDHIFRDQKLNENDNPIV